MRRIFVSQLIGAEGDMMRELIIAGLNSTRLFVLTDNPDRADAVLKGAADDKVFTDTLDIQEGISTHQNAGKGSSSLARTTNGIYAGIGIPTASLIIRKNASMKHTRLFAYATRMAMSCGLRLRRVWEQNSEEQVPTLRRKSRINSRSI